MGSHRVTCLFVAALLTGACVNQTGGVKPSSDASPPATGTSVSLATIQRLDAQVGFVAAWAGGGPGLAKTTDGGLSWQKIAVPVFHITALRFIDRNVGWAAGFIPRQPFAGVACHQAPPSPADPCYGVVLRTVDGGATWQKSLLIPDYGTYGDRILQIQAIDGQRAWALVLNCETSSAARAGLNCPTELRSTSDGGRTWTTQMSGYVVAMRLATAYRGWAAIENPDGSFDVRMTSDGGVTWRTGLRTSSGTVVGIDSANSQTAWAMTQDGGYCSSTTCTKYELLRTTDGGATWSSLGNPKQDPLSRSYAPASACVGGHLVGPLFASPTRGWLAENQGAGGARTTTGLLSTQDGGKTWQCSSVPANTYLVSAADPLHVWALSNPVAAELTSVVYSSDDGGLSWHTLNLGALA